MQNNQQKENATVQPIFVVPTQQKVKDKEKPYLLNDQELAEVRGKPTFIHKQDT